MQNLRVVTALAVILFIGCERSTNAPAADPDLRSASEAMASKPDPSPDIAVEPGGDVTGAVAASNHFGLSLYHHLRAHKGNLAYSPASISLALAMTYAGARGDTAKEMRATLAFPEQPGVLDGGWASVISRWQKVSNIEIALANRLFGDQRYAFEPAYLSLTRSRYGAPLEAVDFAGAAEAQRQRINDWVADETRDRIRNLVPPGGVTADTRMALVNALYFKGTWLTPFDAGMTAEAIFAAPGGSVKVPMMVQTAAMQYGEVNGVKLAQRAYENQRFATLFVLPKREDSITELEGKLDANLLQRWTAALRGEWVAMKLPRFELDPQRSLELSAALQKMGMRRPFQRFEADFTGITNPPNPADRLFIEKIFHKAFVAMDETGTEAAAATAVMMGRAGGVPTEPKTFHADRPFLFFVRDLETDLVMFVGRVVDPS